MRSVLGLKLIAFSDTFNPDFSLPNELNRMNPGYKTSICLHTDTKSFFDIISKGSRSSERRTMIEIAAAKEASKEDEVSDIGLFLVLAIILRMDSLSKCRRLRSGAHFADKSCFLLYSG